MRVYHRVSFQGVQSYEQHTAEFELGTEDLNSKVLGTCNLIETMFVLNTLVCYEGLLFQYVKGYINKESLEGQSKRLFGMLTPKLDKVVKEILVEDGISSAEKKTRTRRTKKENNGETKSG